MCAHLSRNVHPRVGGVYVPFSLGAHASPVCTNTSVVRASLRMRVLVCERVRASVWPRVGALPPFLCSRSTPLLPSLPRSRFRAFVNPGFSCSCPAPPSTDWLPPPPTPEPRVAWADPQTSQWGRRQGKRARERPALQGAASTLHRPAWELLPPRREGFVRKPRGNIAHTATQPSLLPPGAPSLTGVFGRAI